MRFHRGSRSRLLSLHKNWKLLVNEKQMYKHPSTQLFLNLHLNFDFKISPWFLSEYLNLELKWRLNLPLRRNFWHSSKWQLEKCSWINACFLDQKLTSKRCVEIRLLHALKKLILTIMKLIILKNLKLCSWILNPGLAWENLRTTINKKNKISPVFTRNFFKSY